MTGTVTAAPVSLTRRQIDVLKVIRKHLDEHGVPPTRAEIAQALGFRSVNAAEDHLRALSRKGVITLSPGTSRGIQLQGLHAIGIPMIASITTHLPLMSDALIEQRIPLDHRLFSRRVDFLYRVHDSSLRDIGILVNDLIGISQNQPIENGQTVLVRLHHQDICVKRFYRLDANRIELRSAHPDFGTILVDLNVHPLKIEGLVVGLFRPSISEA